MSVVLQDTGYRVLVAMMIQCCTDWYQPVPGTIFFMLIVKKDVETQYSLSTSTASWDSCRTMTSWHTSGTDTGRPCMPSGFRLCHYSAKDTAKTPNLFTHKYDEQHSLYHLYEFHQLSISVQFEILLTKFNIMNPANTSNTTIRALLFYLIRTAHPSLQLE